MKRNFTRQELYELVWSKPISKLAEEFGLSDRGLAKICQRHHIAVPGRGYWAKIDAGQPAKKTPLWKLDNPNIETVYIGERPQQANPYVAFAIKATDAAKQKLQEEDRKADKPKSSSGEKQVAVPNKLPQHSSVKAFSKELLTAQADRTGAINVRWVNIHRDSASRVIGFLSALAHGLEPYGITFSGTQSRVEFVQGDTSVDFEITSPKKRVSTISPHGWTSFENVFVGRLAFRIFGDAEGVRKNWMDSESRKIEDDVPKIVESYRINLVVQAERDEEKHKIDARRRHMAHRRELVEKRGKREHERLEFLNALADDRRQIADLSATIALIPDKNLDERAEYLRMLEWARARLYELEVRTSIDAVHQRLLDRNLFPELDDLHDPEGDPPPKQGYWDD